MHVCFLNEFFYPDMMGGTPKVLSELAQRLKQNHGANVTAVTSRNSYRDPSIKFDSQEIWEGVDIRRVEAPHWSSKRAPQRLAGNILFTRRAASRMLRSVKCDVTFVSTAPVTLPMAAETYKKRRKKPYVYIVYDLDPDRAVVVGVTKKDSRPEKLLRSHQRKWLHGAARVIVIGRCMKEYLVKTYGVPADRITFIPVGADPETVQRLDYETNFRKKHGIEGFTVLYSGNFGKYHDFDTLLDAAKLVGEKDPKINFVLVGRGAKKAHLEARIADEKISNVRMFDFVPDEEYSDLLASADVSLVTLEAGMEGLCVPSKFYSILASGRPTLALMRPNCEVAYTIREHDLGVQVDLGDTAHLAEAILKLPENQEALKLQGIKARNVFDLYFTTPVVAEQTYQLLKEVTGKA